MSRHTSRVNAFRFLVRCLAPSRRSPPPDSLAPENRKLADEVATGRVRWETVVEIASEYWMTLVLYRELREKRLVDSLPAHDRDELVEYFQKIHEANGARNRGILEHAEELVRMLNGIGVEPLLLKGVAHLASGLYPDAALRFMNDIDLLVPDDRALECWRLLTAAGYATRPEYRDKRVECVPQDWPPVEHPDRRGEVEIHRRTEWDHLLASPSLYLDARPLQLGGGKAWILNPTSSLIFTLGHSYVHDVLGLRADTPFRDLYDATLLARRFDREIEWPRVRETFGRAGEAESLRIAGMMWRRLFSLNPPIDPPQRGWIYWQRCLLKIGSPRWGPVGDHLTQNVRALGVAFSGTPEGKRMRKELATPSVFLRKLRSAAQLYGGGHGPSR